MKHNTRVRDDNFKCGIISAKLSDGKFRLLLKSSAKPQRRIKLCGGKLHTFCNHNEMEILSVLTEYVLLIRLNAEWIANPSKEPVDTS